MAFQGTFDLPRGELNKIFDVKGSDLLGTKVRPPLGLAAEVYVLPMEGVLATKVSLWRSLHTRRIHESKGHRCRHFCPLRFS